MTCGTWSSDLAAATMLPVSDAAYGKLDDAITLLSSRLELGAAYDPLYEAQKPPIPFRVFCAGCYGICYASDQGHELIRVHFIGDRCMDPKTRFTGRLGQMWHNKQTLCCAH